MTTYLLRVWLPDRPGALGAVASRIGAVGGDVAGIEILEREAGRAIDELVVVLPDDAGAQLVALLLDEVHQVDDVAVEEIRPVAWTRRDPRLDALETAAHLVGAATPTGALEELCEHAARTLEASWAAVVALDDAVVDAEVGPAPATSWLVAFVAGSQASARVLDGGPGPDDVVWAALPAARRALVVGRDVGSFRARERRHVAALARIVDTRFGELRSYGARRAHPSAPP